MSDGAFDPYYKWLGIPPDEQPPNHYRLLGVRMFESDADVINNAADQRMAHLRSFQTGVKAALSQRVLNEIALARVTLLNPAQRAVYDAALAAQHAVSAVPEEAAEPMTSMPQIRIRKAVARKKSNPTLEMIKIVAGGTFGLFFAVLLLSYFAGMDLLGLQRKTTSSPSPPEKPPASTTASTVRAPPAVGNVPSVPRETTVAKAPEPDIPGYRKNEIGMEFRLIPPGTFTMGIADVEGWAPHQVTISRSFFLGYHEVTQEQYERVMGSNPSYFKAPSLPVESVSWEDAVAFCRQLSARPAERAARHTYRLPTEAEWEYACRASSTTKFSCGDDHTLLPDYAWTEQNSRNQLIP